LATVGLDAPKSKANSRPRRLRQELMEAARFTTASPAGEERAAASPPSPATHASWTSRRTKATRQEAELLLVPAGRWAKFGDFLFSRPGRTMLQLGFLRVLRRERDVHEAASLVRAARRSALFGLAGEAVVNRAGFIQFLAQAGEAGLFAFGFGCARPSRRQSSARRALAASIWARDSSSSP